MSSPLVVFGEDWGAHPSSTQHLMHRLAAQMSVVWVNSIGMRRPQLKLSDIRRAGNKVLGVLRSRGEAAKREAAPAGLSVVSPLAVSWPGSKLAFAANRELLGRQIRKSLAERRIERPILWTSLPTALPALGQLGERAVVYYCGDDFGALTGVDHVPVLEMEAALVKKADLVIAASAVLASRFPAGKTLLVPHGADVSLFSSPSPRAADLPTDGPVAGFYGSLADWIDIELIAHAAAQLPDWRFVLIGQVDTDVSMLQGLPNVRLLGKRAHQELPGYVQHWQASLLPFRDCAQIRACNPLKLREYLAAGRPIVSTEFPALDGYRDLVSVANGRDAFTRAIASCRETPDLADVRRARVKGETWEARAADVKTALEAL